MVKCNIQKYTGFAFANLHSSPEIILPAMTPTKPSRRKTKRNAQPELNFGQLAGDLFGSDTSPLSAGVTNVSGNIKVLLMQILREKHKR